MFQLLLLYKLNLNKNINNAFYKDWLIYSIFIMHFARNHLLLNKINYANPLDAPPPAKPIKWPLPILLAKIEAPISC